MAPSAGQTLGSAGVASREVIRARWFTSWCRIRGAPGRPCTMYWLLLVSSAFAGSLVIDAEVPTEVWLQGQPVVQLFRPGEVRLEAAVGRLPIDVLVDGTRNSLEIDIPAKGSAMLVVGRNGITTDHRAASPDAPTARIVEFQVSGPEEVTLHLDRAKHQINPGGVLRVELPPGDHPMSVRNARGTIVWAAGTLSV